MRLLFVALITLVFAANLQAQEITMFPAFGGVRFYEDNNRISKKEANKLLSDNRASGELWKKVMRQKYWIAGGLAAEIGFVLWAVNRAVNYKNPWGVYAGALGSGAVATGFSGVGPQCSGNQPTLQAPSATVIPDAHAQ